MSIGKSAALANKVTLSAEKSGQKRLYATLCRVLDSLRLEAPPTASIYHPTANNQDALVQARSRALLHLYLKSRFGLTAFSEREAYVTDGGNDGGVDAFFIDKKNKLIHILQAKFRANSENFSTSEITANEILKMDVARILKGQKKNSEGLPYNSKITKNLQGSIQKIPDLASYEIKVVLLANAEKLSVSHLKKLIEGYEPDVFSHKRIYLELLFPVVNGTYFSEPNLSIEINLSNVIGQAHLDYDVKAQGQKTNIKLLFVPTREIGRIMHVYKNSVLKYNPRSFLELTSNLVNKDIEASIREQDSNEFALFNNGVTIISDETKVSSNTAKPDTAQIILRNPQLVNGGQTAYTLSRIYGECSTPKDFAVFKGKEVLLRVITFVGQPTADTSEGRLALLGAISKASNSQTKVDEADRRSNDSIQLELQRSFFEDCGLYYERKRGEFSDGLHSNYIRADDLVERDRLIRVALSVAYKASLARSSISKYYKPTELDDLFDVKDVGKYTYGYEVLRLIEKLRSGKSKTPGDRYNTKLYGQGLRYGQYALLAVSVNEGLKVAIKEKDALDKALNQWKAFEAWASKRNGNSAYKIGTSFDFANYYKGATLMENLQNYPFQF